jgi:hypothetical protein
MEKSSPSSVDYLRCRRIIMCSTSARKKNDVFNDRIRSFLLFQTASGILQFINNPDNPDKRTERGSQDDERFGTDTVRY